MPFKIVSTRRRGRAKLCTVPCQWERNGILRWPKQNPYLLCKNDSVKPRPDWLTIPCSLKRQHFETFQDAEAELTNMLNKTDTDTDGTDFDQSTSTTRQGSKQNSTIEYPCFNSMAQSLVNSPNVSANVTSIPNLNPVSNTDGVIYEILNTDGQMIENVHDLSQTTGNDNTLLQHINNMYMLQNVIVSNQEKMIKKMAEFSVQLEELQLNRQSFVTTLSQAKGMQANEKMKMKAIDNIQGLEQLEKQLSNPETFEALQEKYSIVCSPQPGAGFNCAYRLIDTLFTKDFLCKCSWTGGSRKADVKIGFKGYKNVIRFFFVMVFSWDNTYTLENNENFFKTILRNALKRKESKNIRTSAQKKRVKKNISCKESNNKEDCEKIANKENDTNAANENNNSNNDEKHNSKDENEPKSINENNTKNDDSENDLEENFDN